MLNNEKIGGKLRRKIIKVFLKKNPFWPVSVSKLFTEYTKVWNLFLIWTHMLRKYVPKVFFFGMICLYQWLLINGLESKTGKIFPSKKDKNSFSYVSRVSRTIGAVLFLLQLLEKEWKTIMPEKKVWILL